MKKVLLIIFTLAIVLVIGVVLVGRRSGDVIRIGVVLPLTGPSANHGQDTKDGMNLALEEISSLHMPNNAPIQLIYEDNQSRPADAVSAVNKLIQVDKVKIIIGPIASTDALAMIPVTEKAGILLFSPAASSPEITGKGRLFFRTSLLAAPQGTEAARYIFKNLKSEEAAILFINDDTGRGYSSAFEQKYLSLGGKIIAREQYENTDNDFRTQIIKLKTTGAKVVYAPAIPRTLGLILKQSQELGFDAIFVSNYGSEGEDLLKIAGSTANGRVFLTSFQLSSEFVEKYRAKFKKKPGIAAPLGYDAMLVLCKTISETQSTEPEVLAKGLRSLKEYKGATGRFSFDEFGDPVREIVIRTVENGSFKEIQ